MRLRTILAAALVALAAACSGTQAGPVAPDAPSATLKGDTTTVIYTTQGATCDDNPQTLLPPCEDDGGTIGGSGN